MQVVTNIKKLNAMIWLKFYLPGVFAGVVYDGSFLPLPHSRTSKQVSIPTFGKTDNAKHDYIGFVMKVLIALFSLRYSSIRSAIKYINI